MFGYKLEVIQMMENRLKKLEEKFQIDHTRINSIQKQLDDMNSNNQNKSTEENFDSNTFNIAIPNFNKDCEDIKKFLDNLDIFLNITIQNLKDYNLDDDSIMKIITDITSDVYTHIGINVK